MSVFTPAEVAYLKSQRLGRIATVGPTGQPHVVPVGFRYNPEHDTIDIGGHDLSKREKFADGRAHPKGAFVVDDLAPASPWRPPGIEIPREGGVLPTRRRRGGPGVGP